MSDVAVLENETGSRSRKAKAAMYGTAITGGAALTGVLPVAAFAQEEGGDPTGGAFDGAVGDITSFLTSIAIPGLFAIGVVGIGAAVGLKYLRRVGRTA